MADSTSISSPVTIQPDAKQRVALDLMKIIANNEGGAAKDKREYWLKLYRQCYMVTDGNSFEYTLKGD